jgi:DNA-binding NtrC family response regulator/tetratricopeptide (TPR) repeat protein
MTITCEDADALFKRGEFLKLIDLAGSIFVRDPNVAVRQRLKLANALALAGNLAAANELARRYAEQTYDPSIRSHAECVLALAAWRNGDVASAAKHFPSALRLAAESKDTERIAWTYLHLLRFYIDFHPTDVVLSILPSVRKAVIVAGSRHATAYLHCCVSTLEGQTGRVDEAWRHCQLSESLLENEPNAWILGNSLLNRACVSSLNCDFKKAETYIQAAKDAYSASSNLRSLIIDGSLGYIQLQTGQFVSAQRTLAAILKDPDISEVRKQPVRETSARLHLALNQLDECSFQLARLRTEKVGEDGVPGYITRWAGITSARLLIRRGAFIDALEELRALERDSQQALSRDLPFSAALHLTTAHVLARMGRNREAASRILSAGKADVARHRDLQGQYYYGCSSVLPDSTRLTNQLKNRAFRLWATKGLVAARLEIEEAPLEVEEARDALKVTQQTAPVMPATIECVTNALAAAIDLAYSPRLIGHELASTINALGCASDAVVVETRKKVTSEPGSRVAVLRLGEASGSNVFLQCTIPDDPTRAVLLADIFRIGRAALALEKAKQEERNRSALWPATPIEEQAGALFIAEDMQTLLTTARRVAAANIPVLITGETGTGKEVIARLIHTYSPRASKTFLPFNCSATPREMLDAQLFGHRKGAFTGATEHFAGVIRAAAGGTLFLDEIGESTLDIQPKLLRFLESGEVHPIGDTHPQRVDVRVLAATNADVDALVSQGRFREDLFYRLNIVRLHIPPLRDRRVEIPSFANHYLQKYAKESGKGELRLSEETMEYLVLYRWPGNVRQVANEMRRLAALAEPGAVLMPEHLSSSIAASRRTVPPSQRILDDSEIVVRIDQPMTAAVQHLERTMVQSAMSKTSSVDEAAKMLGLSRKGLYLKRMRFGMEIDRPRGEVEVA